MDILKNSKTYVALSSVLVLISIFFLFFGKLNLGIDMTWGISMEYSYENEVKITEIQDELSKVATEINLNEQIINDTSVYGITGEKALSVVVGFYNNTTSSMSEAEKREADVILEWHKENIRAKTLEMLEKQDSSIIESKYINIWKSFWDYIKNTAILTLSIAIVAIAIYVMHAFAWSASGINVISFALITIVTLFHDVIISTGLYIVTSMYFLEFQIDTFFITALLTILWYSINDTIVVFDRIRSNLKEFAWKKGKEWKELYEIVNISIGETVVRSIYTSMTLLFVLITIFFFGPESISGFILVMIFGTLIGTYSSIFIASPLLYMANKNKKLSIYKKVEISAEDKIVV
jgi:preprotein translocase subunit SecF